MNILSLTGTTVVKGNRRKLGITTCTTTYNTYYVENLITSQIF